MVDTLKNQAPVEAYAGLRGGVPSFLFESAGRSGPRTGRYSLAGRGNGTTLWGSKGNYELKSDHSSRKISDPLSILNFPPSLSSSLPLSSSGRKAWVGALGYGLRTQIEDVPSRSAEGSQWPDVALMQSSGTLVWDHPAHDFKILGSFDDLGSQQSPSGALSPSRRVSPSPPRGRGFTAGPPELDQDQAGFVSRVKRAKEAIAEGEIYQANLSLRFRGKWEGDPLDLYRALRSINPSPFAGYIEFPERGLAIVSSSPERLVSLRGSRISMRPIAGTRPRGGDLGSDRALKQEMFLSAKERAEHVMLVDLARNDLGRVASWGSVSVEELFVGEAYSHVQHIVSEVSGRLHQGKNIAEILRATFPGGTITGCPKVRSMEIIEALEPSPRGFYTGSCGYVLPDGMSDWNILIRTIAIQRDPKSGEGFYEFGAGAGIVADSIPEKEYEECLHKAKAMAQALGHPIST